uniref:CSON013438 protein n=1 Tax=Culicoides sonorensis TaxID=179676 RepID=A0A336M820_CULSO
MKVDNFRVIDADDPNNSLDQINDARDKRFVKDKKFGFFGGIAQMGKLAYEQYTDTTKTLQSILDLLNNSFSDTATEPPKSVTETSVTNETTTETYRISRKELGRILNRNFRGLQKLLRIEVNDAFNVRYIYQYLIFK